MTAASTPTPTVPTTTILVAAEAQWVREQVRAAFVGPGQGVVEVSRGQDVFAAVAEHHPDLVILDLQIANMGGIAVSIDLRLEGASRNERLCTSCFIIRPRSEFREDSETCRVCE